MKTFTAGKTLVAVAIPQEITKAKWAKRGPIVFTGVGKINTCINLYEAITNFKPNLVLNLGSAGSLKKDLRGVVEVSSVIERDFDARPLCERGLIPFEDHKNKYSSGFDGVICASGDSFVHEEDSWLTDNLVDVVDMELIAIAKTCNFLGVPWRSFKFISDYVGRNKSDEWKTGIKESSTELLKVFDKLFT
jgi:adenosylhomocysteine nucleosidase